MSKRSDEREQFYADIITGAVEGGTGYWAYVLRYQWRKDDGSICVSVGARDGDKASCVLAEMEEFDEWRAELGNKRPTVPEAIEAGKAVRITTDDIARAFGVLDRLVPDPEPPQFGQGPQLLTSDGERAYVSVAWRKRMQAALRELDAGDIDADDADNLAQLAAFGKAVFG